MSARAVSRVSVRRDTVWVWYLACAAALAGAYLLVPPFRGNPVMINVVGLLSLVAIGAGVRMHRPALRAAWIFLLVGQSLYVAGDFYTYTYPQLLGGKVGFPSPGDAIYLLVYPALFAGLVLLVRRRNPVRDRAAMIDSLILTLGCAVLSWIFLVAPNIHLSGLSVLAKMVSVAYPLGDILLLAAIIRLAVDAGTKTLSFYMLVAGTVALLTTDCAYNYALLVNGYHHQLIYDAGWLAYLILWGGAALHPSMRALEKPATNHRIRLTRLRLALLALACLIAPGIHFAQNIGNSDLLVVVGASALLFLLVVARMAGLVRQEERTAMREVALRQAGVELVAAAGREGVNRAVIAAARTILGDDARIRLLLWTTEGVQLAASTDSIDPDDAQGLLEWVHLVDDATVYAIAAGSAAAVALGLDDQLPTLRVRLAVRDADIGALFIQTATELPRELQSSLAALASQVSLALDAVSLAESLHHEKSEARFRSLVAHASDLITVLDADGVVTYQSPSVERLLGYSVADVEGRRFDELLAQADRPRLAQVVSSGRDGGPETHTLEFSLHHRDGRLLQFEVQHTQLLQDEHIHGIVLNSRDVSERKAFEHQLAHQAFHDPVTNLANRALFADRVGHALRSTVRQGSLIGVMFVDLDDFKTVNDSLGHQAGDTVLKEVGRRLEAVVRPADTVARFGGDEFAILLDDIGGSDEAAAVADRIVEALEAPTEIDGKQLCPRGSIGICISDEDLLSQDVEELLRNADLAMYMAKRDSKGSYRLFEPTMHERVVERLELRSQLERALAEKQLEVFYQPVVRLSDGDEYGVEALLRWHHPERGLVAPAQFIPLAEETGLIIPIGRWVLREACKKGVELQRVFPSPQPLRMSINLSVKQLQAESIVADVREALEASSLPPSSLVLEVTETVMLADADIAAARLHELKDLGVRIAMDDFGTGYSSLSYLSRLPVDILKMDRSFLVAGNADNGLAAAIMAIGERLGMEVIAEGIETTEQSDSLKKLGFELGQGFLFGKAMPHPSLVDHLLGDGTAAKEMLEPDAA
jgi:diguanylate cyclase (GGDEF)-like protein/PAS domain S-box-containing protein